MQQAVREQRQRSTRAFAVLLLTAFCLFLGACSASARAQVTLRGNGTGSVAVSVHFDRAAAARLEDLKSGLPVADLRAAGWSVKGPSPAGGGSVEVSASHPFTSMSEIPVLLADVAGTGPAAARPFHLQVKESEGLWTNSFVASGHVDLRCWLSCFDDPKLAKDVGYPLGLSHSQLMSLLGAPGKELTFSFGLSLPGSVGKADAGADRSDGTLVWATPLGTNTDVGAEGSTINVAHAIELAVAAVAGLLAVVVIAVLLLGRRHSEAEPARHGGGRPAR